MCFLHHKATLNPTLVPKNWNFQSWYVGQVRKPHRNATSLGYF